MWHWGLLHFLVTTALTYLQSKLSDSFLLRLVAVSGGASGASTTGPGARTIGSPGTPLSMHRVQVQLLVHTHTMSAILHVNKHKDICRNSVKNNSCNSLEHLKTIMNSLELCCKISPQTAGRGGFLCIFNLLFGSHIHRKKVIQKKCNSANLWESSQVMQLSKEKFAI